MFCTECGAKLNSGAKFCGKCGTAISLEEQEENNDLNQKNQQNKSAPSSTGLNEEGKYDPGSAASRGVKTKPPAPKGYDPGLAASRGETPSIGLNAQGKYDHALAASRAETFILWSHNR